MNPRVRFAIACAALALVVTAAATGDNITISQIDASRLLLNQTVTLYLSVTDAQGRPRENVSPDSFAVQESPDGRVFRPVPEVLRVQAGGNRLEGINFLLLIDNSGSMYDTLAGKQTENDAERRITLAERAIREFVASVTNPRDAVGLAVFNTDHTLLVPPVRGQTQVGDFLKRISRPGSEQAYTELYASILLSARDLSAAGGRKVLIVLSDGENYPYLQYSGKEHPRFGRRVFRYSEDIEECQREGISVFAINFGREKDPHLASIAVETGGAVFDAADEQQLGGVYAAIRERVLKEVVLAYRATMEPAERKHVRVDYAGPGGKATATRFYFASTLFGLPQDRLGLWLLLPLILGLGLIVALVFLRLDRRRGRPSLEVLYAPGRASTRVFDLGSGRTVIGGSDRADLTIAGVPTVRDNHATVVYDEKKKSYTVMAEGGEVTVNNRPVRSRQLQSGDVINVGGATIVFDEASPPAGGAGGGGKKGPTGQRSREERPQGRERKGGERRGPRPREERRPARRGRSGRSERGKKKP